jgi:hypothetical protein
MITNGIIFDLIKCLIPEIKESVYLRSTNYSDRF